MKLLKIQGDTNRSLDAILMVVPDDYDEETVIENAMDLNTPVIVEEISIGDEGDFDLYYPYLG